MDINCTVSLDIQRHALILLGEDFFKHIESESSELASEILYLNQSFPERFLYVSVVPLLKSGQQLRRDGQFQVLRGLFEDPRDVADQVLTEVGLELISRD